MGRWVWFLAAAVIPFGAVVTGALGAKQSNRGANLAVYLVVAQQDTGCPAHIETLRADGRVLKVLGRAAPSWSGPAQWSADHSRIVWVGPHGVTTRRLSGGGTRVLARCSVNCGGQSFALSPDGHTVLVGGAGPHGYELVTVSVATGRQRLIASGGPAQTLVAKGWSPDGKSILYAHVSPNDVEAQIVVARRDGSRKRVVMRAKHPIGPPDAAWAPTGREISFAEQSGPMDAVHTRVGVLDLPSRRIHLIRIKNLGDGPVWSWDSTKLALAEEYGGIFTVGPTGRRLHTFRITAWRLAWGRTGLFIVPYGSRGDVYRSPDGLKPARRLFALKRQSILTLTP
jgi:Tol biopolymer transport system component